MLFQSLGVDPVDRRGHLGEMHVERGLGAHAGLADDAMGRGQRVLRQMAVNTQLRRAMRERVINMPPTGGGHQPVRARAADECSVMNGLSECRNGRDRQNGGNDALNKGGLVHGIILLGYINPARHPLGIRALSDGEEIQHEKISEESEINFVVSLTDLLRVFVG